MMKAEYIIPGEALTALLVLSFVLLVLVVLRYLGKAQADAGNGYDWHDLLMENGKASKAAHVMLGAFVVTTWHFVYYAVTNRLSEGYYAIYAGAWIAPVIARLIWNPTMATGQPVQTTTTTTTETK